MKAVLFDIDGTLVNCNGAGRSSLTKATREVFGTIGHMERVDFQGKTDPVILSESLHSMGFNHNDIITKTDTLKELYFAHLAEDVHSHSPELLPGVEAILDRLHSNENIVLGLLTGNFYKSARIKLERFSLNKYFPFGAFGDDAPVRNELPPVAQKKIKDLYNLSIDYKDMIIIGDTVHDITCAQAVGAKSVAVGTGWIEKKKLLAQEPDFFFDDLANTDQVLDAILSQS